MVKLGAHNKATIFYGAIISIYNMADKLYGAVFILLMSSREINPLQISTIFATSSLALAIFDYPSGNVADRYGRKKITGVGFIIWGFGLLLFGYSNDNLGFIISSIIMSLGIALISGSPQAWYVDQLKEIGMLSYKDKAMPKLSGIGTAFAIVGAMLSAVLVNIKLEAPIIVAGSFAIVAGFFTLTLLKDNYGGNFEKNILIEIINNTKKFFKDQNMRILLARNILSHVAFISFILSWQIYGVQKLGLDPSINGILLIVFMVILSVAGFLVSKLTDYLKPTIISILGMGVAGLGLLIIYLKPSALFFIIGICIFEFGLGIDLSAYNAWVHDFIPSEKRATFFSGLSAIKSLAGFFITILLGYFTVYYGYASTWLLASIAQLSALLVFLFSVGKLR